MPQALEFFVFNKKRLARIIAVLFFLRRILEDRVGTVGFDGRDHSAVNK